jgi:hypothetical protein
MILDYYVFVDSPPPVWEAAGFWPWLPNTMKPIRYRDVFAATINRGHPLAARMSRTKPTRLAVSPDSKDCTYS